MADIVPGKPATDIMYCSRSADGYMRNFMCSPLAVRMTFTRDPEVVKVRVVPDEKYGNKWAWHDFAQDNFAFVFDTLTSLGCCFTYGLEATEKAGKGIRVKVRVEVIEVVKGSA